MIYTEVRNSDGKPTLQVDVPAGLALPVKAGFSWVTGEVPSREHHWNFMESDWVLSAPDLDKAKEVAWTRIKEIRESRLKGTFEHDGNTYDVDPVNIAGAAVDAREALTAEEQNWSQMWVLSNNTVVVLDAAQMIALGRAAKAVVSDLWAISQALRMQIEAATTVEQVEAVVWP